MLGLNPYLSGENHEFYNHLKSFAKAKLFPGVEERDEKAFWSKELWNKMGEMGLNGLAIPEEYGGQGAGCLQCCIAGEAISAGSADGGFILAWGAHIIIGTMPIVLFGTEEQKKKYLPKLATGEWIAGLGLTEPGSGSDAAGLITRALDRGDHFLVNGSKMFITNGSIGDVFICMIRTKEGESRGPLGISALIVEKTLPGFSVGKVLKKLGMHTSTTSELIFQDMVVPKENLLGPLHSGFMRIGRATLEWERTVLVSSTSGMMEFVLEQTLNYSINRKQFGKPIIEFPAIQEKIAKNWVYLMAARRYIYYVASAKDAGLSLPMQAAILKLLATEPGVEIAEDGVQILGGYGYMKEYHLERIYRDVKLSTIGAGTSEVMRSIISSSFPGWEEFTKSLYFMYPEEIRKIAENKYSGDNSEEFKLLFALENLVKDISKKIKKVNSQIQEFAFADLVMIYSGLKQAYWDLGVDSGNYSTEEKKRDFKLLSYFLITKYVKSIRNLSDISEEKSNTLIQFYLRLGNIEEKIKDCVDSLSGKSNE